MPGLWCQSNPSPENWLLVSWCILYREYLFRESVFMEFVLREVVKLIIIMNIFE